MIKILLSLALGIILPITGYLSFQSIEQIQEPQEPQELQGGVGAALFEFKSSQLSTTTATSGHVLKTNGTDNYWDTAGGGSSPFTDEGTVIVSTNGESIRVASVEATSTTATSTFAGGVTFGTGFYWQGVTERLSLGANEDVMSINGIQLPSKLAVHVSGDSLYPAIETHSHSDTAAGAAITYGARSRGTEGAETIVQSGDNLFDMFGVGYDGTDYAVAASIEMEVDGTPGSNDMPGRIKFATTPDGTQTRVERMRIDSAGNVGIGTTSPYAKLSVAGQTVASYFTATSTTQHSTFANNLAVGTTSASTAMFEVNNEDSSQSTGMIRVISNATAGGDYDFRIDSPNPDIEFIETDQTTPAGKFEMAVNSDYFQITGRNAADNSFEGIAYFERVADGGRVGFNDSTPDAMLDIVYTGTEDLLYLSSGSTGNGDMMALNNSGVLSVGDFTTANGTYGKIQLNSNAISPSSIDLANTIAVGTGTGGANATNKYLGQFGFLSRDSSFTSPKLVAYIGAEATETYGADTDVGSDLVFYTGTQNNTSATEKMRIKDSGNVGIGTTSPYAKLSVAGQTVASYFTATSTTVSSVLPYLTISSVLDIPSGTSPTVDAEGEMALDTTDNQLLIADSGGTARVIQTEVKIWGTTIASTSQAFIDAGLLPVPTQLDGYTITRIQCHVTGGTSKVIAVEDASANSSEDITCGTTNTTDDGSITNATYTASELSYIDFGATSGSVNYVTISVFGKWTRE